MIKDIINRINNLSGDWLPDGNLLGTIICAKQSRGLSIRKSHLIEPQRLNQLTIVECLAHLWLACLGVYALQEKWRRLLHLRTRCDLSLFRQWAWLLAHTRRADPDTGRISVSNYASRTTHLLNAEAGCLAHIFCLVVNWEIMTLSPVVSGMSNDPDCVEPMDRRTQKHNNNQVAINEMIFDLYRSAQICTIRLSRYSNYSTCANTIHIIS